MQTAIDAGHLHARIEAVQDERAAWREEAGQLDARVRARGYSHQGGCQSNQARKLKCPEWL